jgi:hypothetical protein
LDSAYFGTVTANGPNGLGHLTGVTNIDGGTITDLDAFAEALSEAEQVGAQLTAFVAHPDTVLAMSTLKPTTSNPCWALTRARRRDGQCSVSRCTRRRPSAPTSCGVCRWRSVSS